MLIVENVSKKFESKENYADYKISFNAKDGEVIGVVGPNGAGKTTLLRMLGGILQPTDGKILFDDKTYEENEIEIKKNIGYLSENTQIYKAFTTYEFLNMCCDIYSIDKKARDKKISSILKKLKIENLSNQRIEHLSTGQTQKVNIARLLIHNPKYYILDEVTNGLDIMSSEIIARFVKEEKKNNKVVIYSTHHMEEIESICDRLLIIDEGKVIENDTVQNILKKTKKTNLREAFFEIIGGESL